jgi:hypothetical protein
MMNQPTAFLRERFVNTGRMLPFNGHFIYPPRAENALPTRELDRYEGLGYVAQPKLDGNCCLLFGNGTSSAIMDRHASGFSKEPKLFADGTLQKLHRGNGWSLLVGEYMAKSKTDEHGANFNDRFVIHDLIALDGMQLTGSTFGERIALLDELYGTEASDQDELMSTPVNGVYRVRSHREGFAPLFERVTSKARMYEGLVLKSLGGLLENGMKQRNTSASQAKFRRPTKNYAY